MKNLMGGEREVSTQQLFIYFIYIYIYILSIKYEISKSIHWCPFSERVSTLSPDPQHWRKHKC